MKESSFLVLNGGVIPKSIFVLCFVLIAFCGRMYSQVGETFSSTFEQATTDHQKDVILFQNGQWKFAFEDDHKSFVVSDSASDPYQFARLQDGRRVVIYSVGTWRFLDGEQSKEATNTLPSQNTTPVGNIQGTQKATNSILGLLPHLTPKMMIPSFCFSIIPDVLRYGALLRVENKRKRNLSRPSRK